MRIHLGRGIIVCNPRYKRFYYRPPLIVCEVLVVDI